MPRPTFRFGCKGVDLAHPVDAMPEGFYPILRNVRVSTQGDIEQRQGLDAAVATTEANPVHSLRRMNNGVDSTFSRFAGVASKVYVGAAGALTQQDNGYSGNPLSLIPFRPNRSPYPYMYVGDSAKLRKFAPDGSNFAVGIMPPSTAPVLGLGVPVYGFVTDTEATINWAATGTAAALASVARINTTISQILYDAGNAGWACIVPAAMDNNVQVGAKVRVNGAEDTKIRSVAQAITTTTVAQIIYDAGATGACSIVLTDNGPNLDSDCVIQIGAEYVRVRNVVKGQEGSVSFRCSTTGTHAAGEAVTGYPSFRCYLVGTYAATQTITNNALSIQVAKGTGTLAKTAALKLDVLTPVGGVGGRPVTTDDYIHLSVLIDNPANLVEGRVMFDIGDGSFTKSFYYKPFRASDLTPNVQGQLTYNITQQVMTQRAIYDSDPLNPDRIVGYEDVPEDVVIGQAVTGNSQWTEFRFKVSDFLRVGSDQSKSLANVTAVGFQFNCLGTVNLLVGSLWIGGTYGPDILPSDAQLLYATRYRSSTTGAKSNPSPATRTGIEPHRESVTVTLTASADPQVDTIDLLRFGGGVNRFKVIGSYPNQTQTVIDKLQTLAILANEEGSFDDYQPFPISDLPRAGTCNVAGTTVKRLTGDPFNVNWVPGSQIILNGNVCTLYGSPLSVDQLQIVETVGALTNATFQLPEPTIAAQPLPAMWSFGGQGIGTYLMGVGDRFNPGFLHWCKGNDPDAASDTGDLEITSPSEPLMNGCEFDGRAFVFSTERLFALFPNFGVINYGGVGQTVNANGGNMFTAQMVVEKAGLFARYGLTVTPHGIAWVGKDGIYLWAGGSEPKSLTNDALYPLFPHGDDSGKAVNGYYPPDFAQPLKLRLYFADASLFFLYPDTQGTPRCMRFDFRTLGWFPYDFTPAATAICAEEGNGVETVIVAGTDGKLYPLSDSTLDAGMAMPCQVRTPSFDLGDTRTLKYFADALLDHTGTFICTLGFDNYTATLPAVNLNQATRGQSLIGIALNDGDNLKLYRNIALDTVWTGAGTLYVFQPNAVVQPMLVAGLVTQYTDHGIPGYSHEKEAWVGLISTADVTMEIWTDGTKHTFKIPSTGGKYARQRVFLGPLKGKAWLYKLSSMNPFIPFPEDIVVMVKRWGAESSFMPYHPFQPNLNTLGEGRAFAGGIPTGA